MVNTSSRGKCGARSTDCIRGAGRAGRALCFLASRFLEVGRLELRREVGPCLAHGLGHVRERGAAVVLLLVLHSVFHQKEDERAAPLLWSVFVLLRAPCLLPHTSPCSIESQGLVVRPREQSLEHGAGFCVACLHVKAGDFLNRVNRSSEGGAVWR